MQDNQGASQATGLAGAEAPEPPSRLVPTGGIPCAGFRCVHCGHRECIPHVFTGELKGMEFVDCAACGIMHSPPNPQGPRALRDALESLLAVVEEAIRGADWVVDGSCDPDRAIYRARSALGLPSNG